MHQNIVFLAFLLVAGSCKDTQSGSLRFVHVFFRHGSRTPEPYELYPTDPFGELFRKIGYGQLTNRGKQMEYQLGKVIRNRYENFLGNNYRTEILKMRSTDVDRTKQSALLVLAGLFPPNLKQKWDEHLNWLPIPYDYEKHERDYDLRRVSYYCPAYDVELNKTLDSAEAQKIRKEHTETFKYVSNHTGTKVNTLKEMYLIYHTLNAEAYLNITLPEWTQKVYPDEIGYLASMQNLFENHNTKLKRLNGGRILTEVLGNMELKAKRALLPKERRMNLYSIHDNNVVAILAALNIYKPHFPKFSSAIFIELHEDLSTSSHFVKVFYLKSCYDTPEEQTIPECGGKPCKLEQFIEIFKPIIPQNYTQECGSEILLD